MGGKNSGRKGAGTLEKAIRKSLGEAVVETDSAIIIDRATFASRKRGRLALSTLSNVPIVMNEDEINDDDIDYWKKRCETLEEEKEEQTRIYSERIELYKEKERKLEEFVHLLEQKIEKLKKGGGDPVPAEDKSEWKELCLFYKTLSGMTIKQTDDEFLCTVKNSSKRILTKFAIQLSEDGSLSFVPDTNIEYLPEYLQASVAFDKALAPLMLGDVLQTMFAE